MTGPVIRVFVVEDNTVMRQMLAEFIDAQPDMECTGSVGTAEDALARPEWRDADVVVADLRLPGMNGAELIGKLLGERPSLPCLVLSGHTQESYVEAAMARGARGYVLKGRPPELTEAIRELHEGGRYLSPALPEESDPDGEG